MENWSVGRNFWWILILIQCLRVTIATDTSLVWDDRGYILFCLCMGRFGNQADHFLGGLAFAKEIDRTLIVPPFRTYKNVPFTDWFRLESLASYHRVISAEDFMENLAPNHWPEGNRTGLCFSFDPKDECTMKQGNPFQQFWDGLGVDFDHTESYSVTYKDPEKWKSRFPASTYPVLALRGAPAPYPIVEEHRHLQKYLQWSDFIVEEGQKYIQANFPGQKFLGIHLRNGKDWENACSHIDSDYKSYMASPQCINPSSGQTLTQEICLPSMETVLRQTEKIIQATGCKVIYVATDRYPLTTELSQRLQEYQVQVYHQDPHLPQVDLYILGQADHFIGNCVSSFTAFVARERTVNGKATSFWAL